MFFFQKDFAQYFDSLAFFGIFSLGEEGRTKLQKKMFPGDSLNENTRELKYFFPYYVFKQTTKYGGYERIARML